MCDCIVVKLNPKKVGQIGSAIIFENLATAATKIADQGLAPVTPSRVGTDNTQNTE